VCTYPIVDEKAIDGFHHNYLPARGCAQQYVQPLSNHDHWFWPASALQGIVFLLNLFSHLLLAYPVHKLEFPPLEAKHMLVVNHKHGANHRHKKTKKNSN
jgi:hypothetical protein